MQLLDSLLEVHFDADIANTDWEVGILNVVEYLLEKVYNYHGIIFLCYPTNILTSGNGVEKIDVVGHSVLLLAVMPFV